MESFVRTHLHDVVGAEVKGLRASAGIADLSAFSKTEISGPGAETWLNRISSNRIPQKNGSVMLTYLVMENGRIEGEATLVKLGEQSYYMVYAAAKEAVDRARSGGGPSMLENVTYRMSVHTTADDPTRYRTNEEVEVWAKRDPITRFQKYLTELHHC